MSSTPPATPFAIVEQRDGWIASLVAVPEFRNFRPATPDPLGDRRPATPRLPDCHAQRINGYETNGDHLSNPDTAHNREVLTFLSDDFIWDDALGAGEWELVKNDGATVQGTLILMNEWKAKLPNLWKAGHG